MFRQARMSMTAVQKAELKGGGGSQKAAAVLISLLCFPGAGLSPFDWRCSRAGFYRPAIQLSLSL